MFDNDDWLGQVREDVINPDREIVDPHRNVGRTIVISIVICAVTYLLVALAVGSSLTPAEIEDARDYALAEAAKPVLGQTAFYLTVALAMVATASGIEPPRLNWSTAIVRKRRIRNGEQATQAGRDCHEATAS